MNIELRRKGQSFIVGNICLVSMLEKLTYQEPVVEEAVVVEEVIEEPKKPALVKKAVKKSEKE